MNQGDKSTAEPIEPTTGEPNRNFTALRPGAVIPLESARPGDEAPRGTSEEELDAILEEHRRPDMTTSGDTKMDLGFATWAAGKAKAAARHIAEVNAWRAAEKERVDAAADHAIAPHQDTLDRMTELLSAYLRAGIEDGSIKRRSLKLPGGTIKLTRRQPALTIDATAFVLWAENNNHEDLIRIKKEADLATLRRRATLAEGGVVAIDGEIIPDATWEEQDDSAKFAPEEETA